MLVPRYCGNCGNVYWLKNVRVVYNEGLNYYRTKCDCGSYMCSTKKMAMEEFRKKS